MKKSPLLGALPIIAQALGRQLGVNVVIGGAGAGTDGRTIYLPALPAEGEAQAILAHGFIDHEAAHLRYTDFTVQKPDGLAGALTNLLEDIRIEQALGAEYPGSRRNLAALVAYLETHDPLQPAAAETIGARVLIALYGLLRARVLGQDALAPAADAREAQIEAQLPEGVVVKLLALAFEVRQARSTADVKALALRIVAMLDAEARTPESPPSGDEAGSSSHHGPLSSGASTATGHGPSSSGDSGDSGAVLGAGAGSGGAAVSAAVRRQVLATLLASDDETEVIDLGTRAGERLGELAAASGALRVTLAEDDDPPRNLDPAAAVAQACAATAQLRRRLGALVQACRDEEVWRARRGHRLNTAGLYRLSTGDAALFRRCCQRVAPATAVGLLLDRSGSMHPQIQLAGQAVLATALALEEIDGVSCWAAAFPGRHPHQIVPLKGFAERTRRVAGRFGLAAGGGTPLANALWRAGFELIRRPEPRRLLIVATDGQPHDEEAVSDILARCRASGIEVIGLGIGQSLTAVRAVFGDRDAAAIEVITALAPALFALLERRLAPAG